MEDVSSSHRSETGDMTMYDEDLLATFGREAMNEIYDIYNNRKGGMETVDREAIKRVLDRFPDATDKEKSYVQNWAAFRTRQ